jgi:hypothetical protein
MAIDINEQVDAGFLLRWMSVDKLKSILEKLESGVRKQAKGVANVLRFKH